MASSDASDDYEWQPPTEAEMKIIQARRERSDKISKLMGDYLLKGYKMLGSTCPTCMTILLQDKEGKNYCVACSELDADGNKDDPALSREAARRQVAEERERGTGSSVCTPDSPSTPGDGYGVQENPPPPPPRVSAPTIPSRVVHPSQSVVTTTAHSTAVGGASSYQGQYYNVPASTSTVIIQAPPKVLNGNDNVTSPAAMDVSQPIVSVKTKLHWACAELDRTSSVEASIQLCQLIKWCADALMSLQTLHSKPGQSG